jgi:hypothetical protein
VSVSISPGLPSAGARPPRDRSADPGLRIRAALAENHELRLVTIRSDRDARRLLALLQQRSTPG